jgi:hypothetical protein
LFRSESFIDIKKAWDHSREVRGSQSLLAKGALLIMGKSLLDTLGVERVITGEGRAWVAAIVRVHFILTDGTLVVIAVSAGVGGATGRRAGGTAGSGAGGAAGTVAGGAAGTVAGGTVAS